MTKHTILYVDDEKPIISSVKRLFRRESFHLLTASSGEQGLELLKENKVHLVISDQRMPRMTGADFLARVKEQYPDTIRILLTGYTEINSIQEAINKGNIYKFLLKPWDGENLKVEVHKSLEQHDLIQANRSMDQLIVQQNKALEQANKNLEQLTHQRTRELESKIFTLELANEIFQQMPIPVVCVGEDNRLMLVNQQARELVINNKKLVEEKPLTDYFSNKIMDRLTKLFTSDEKEITINRKINDREYAILCCPMTGKSLGKLTGHGIVLHFQPGV